MSKFTKFKQTYGWLGTLQLIIYPLVSFVTNPVRLYQTIRNCVTLTEGKTWPDTPHFMPRSAFTSLFYRTRALNISRYGTSGTTPYLGLGNYDLTRTFYYTHPSLYMYSYAGAVTLLLGMLGWWAGYFLWLDSQIATFWLLLVMGLTLVSSTFYANTFAKQNYNVLGWLFTPVVLYAWLTKNWLLAALGLLGISFTSVTVLFIFGLLAVALSLQIWSLNPIFSILPACLKFMTHLSPLLVKGNFNTIFAKIMKAIGLTKKNVKYARKEAMKFDIERFYRFGLTIQFIFVFIYFNGFIPVLLTFSLLLWLSNSRVFRFADDQSLEMLILTTATVTLLQSNSHHWLLLVSFWLLASPLFPFGRILEKSHFLILPELKPFNIRPILDDMAHFLSPVNKNQRVLMAFGDPKGNYEEIFDRYRTLVEVIHYVANTRDIHFMPDWWGVFELNYEGAKDFWGREVDEVKNKLIEWKADFTIVYQPAGTELEGKWNKAGFKQISHFSWQKYEKDFYPQKPYQTVTPDWWLLKLDM